MQVTTLRCEYTQNPLGIAVSRPRLSWRLESERRGACQSAYRVLTAANEAELRDEGELLWDSGKVASDRSIHVEYAGPPVSSRQRVHWTVQVWDEQDQLVTAAEHAWWEMALLSKQDWQAQWIGTAASEPAEQHANIWQSGTLEELIAIWQQIQQQAIATAKPCPYLRKAFQTSKPVKRARIYTTARGLYELFINGQRVAEDYFRPGWTDYHKRIQYQTYDITALLSDGENAIGVVLADGWYCGVIGGAGFRNYYGRVTQALVQGEIEYTDGSIETICSDASWRTAPGPLLYADLYMGESYDARRELPGWATASYDDSAWQAVVAEPRDEVALVAQIGPSVRKVEELCPRTVSEPVLGRFVFDLGQNMVGWARLRVQGEAGTTIQIRYAEMLNPDGTIYTTNLRTARATDTYILKGSASEDYLSEHLTRGRRDSVVGARNTDEVYEPSFTFHGFRYVELTGYPGRPTLEAITGVVLQSDTPATGTFTCSSPLVNQLVQNIAWGQRGNFLEVPTDCPQRDERLGWTGDAQIFVRTATYNADVAGFFSKWLADIEDSQLPNGGIPNIIPSVTDPAIASPGWADAVIIVPWTIAHVYGDTRLLERSYGMMSRWVEFIASANPDHLWRAHRNGDGNGQWDFGDWLSVGAETPKDVLAAAFWAYSVSLLATIAETLGKTEDAQLYNALFQHIKAAFQAAYVTADGRITGNTQTVYVLALSFQLLAETLRPLAAQHLVEDIQARGGHLSTGFLGVGHLLPALTENGYADVAYQLLLKETFPSWGYSIRHGATTIWERWDGWTEDKGFQDPGMNSFNHYSLGSVGDWLYRYVAGIDTAIGSTGMATGYKHIILRPYPDPALTSAQATYESIQGKIVSEWQYQQDGVFEWRITVPANTTATVYVPTTDADTVSESGKPVAEVQGIALLRRKPTTTIYHVVAGTYHFRVRKDT